jgi:hypothetical protein
VKKFREHCGGTTASLVGEWRSVRAVAQQQSSPIADGSFKKILRKKEYEA